MRRLARRPNLYLFEGENGGGGGGGTGTTPPAPPADGRRERQDEPVPLLRKNERVSNLRSQFALLTRQRELARMPLADVA